MSNRTPTPTDDLIDSREVIEAIDEAYADYVDGCNGGDEEPLDFDEWLNTGADDSYDQNVTDLIELNQEGDDQLSDWRYGVTLVSDAYFESYAQELAEDIGAINRDAEWPLSYIDWEAAADALRMDYTELSFGGNVYWAR